MAGNIPNPETDQNANRYFDKPIKIEIGKGHGCIAPYARSGGFVLDSTNKSQMDQLWKQLKAISSGRKRNLRLWSRTLDQNEFTPQELVKIDKLLEDGETLTLVYSARFGAPQFRVQDKEWVSGNEELSITFKQVIGNREREQFLPTTLSLFFFLFVLTGVKDRHDCLLLGMIVLDSHDCLLLGMIVYNKFKNLKSFGT